MKIGDRLRWKILKFSFQVIQIQIQQRPNGGTLEFREGGGGDGEGRKQKKKLNNAREDGKGRKILYENQ